MKLGSMVSRLRVTNNEEGMPRSYKVNVKHDVMAKLKYLLSDSYNFYKMKHSILVLFCI